MAEAPADKTEFERAKGVQGGLRGLKRAVRAYRQTEQEVARLQEAGGTPEDEPAATDERRDESGPLDTGGAVLSPPPAEA